MNVDETKTDPAGQRKMEAHRSYIDIQMVIESKECIGYQPVANAGEVVEDKGNTDAWFYNPSLDADTQIQMGKGTLRYLRRQMDIVAYAHRTA